jgi:hypothetical protein
LQINQPDSDSDSDDDIEFDDDSEDEEFVNIRSPNVSSEVKDPRYRVLSSSSLNRRENVVLGVDDLKTLHQNITQLLHLRADLEAQNSDTDDDDSNISFDSESSETD